MKSQNKINLSERDINILSQYSSVELTQLCIDRANWFIDDWNGGCKIPEVKTNLKQAEKYIALLEKAVKILNSNQELDV